MQKYESLIFDLDDTLIDNNQSIKYAFEVIVNQLGLICNDELFEKWKRFDTTYWHNWESGKMIIPDFKNLEEKITYLRANRFMIFFKFLDITYDESIKINNLYCKMLGVNIVEIEGAKKLLQDLYSNYEIFVATNGPKDAAISKLKKAKLELYVSSIVCSEEVGFSKPMLEFFNYLFGKMPNKDKSKMLLIGDSLTTDILGGMNSGIDTCWFNPNNSLLPDQYYPTISINKLLQLKKEL